VVVVVVVVVRSRVSQEGWSTSGERATDGVVVVDGKEKKEEEGR